MPQSGLSDYIVVNCQKAPNGKESHVCVPRSWIRCEMGEGRVAIVYPCEDDAFTAARVKNKAKGDDSWNYYIGDIKCETNSYDYAMTVIHTILLYEEYLRDTNQDTNTKQKEKKPKEQPIVEQKDSLKVRIKLPKPSEKKKKKSKSKSRSSKSSKYEIITERTPNSDPEPVSENNVNAENNSSQPKDPNTTTESCIPASTVNKTTAQTQITLADYKIEEMLQSYLPDCLLKHIPINNLNKKGQQEAENIEMDIDTESIATSLAFPSLTPEEREFIIKLETEQRKTIYNIKLLVLYVRNMYIKVCENKNTLSQIITKYGPTSPNVTGQEKQAETSSDNTEDGPQDIEMAAEPEVPVTSTDNTLEEMEPPLPTSTTSEPVTEKESHAKKEKINWVLKHPDPGKGLVELGKYTGVYVSAEGLKNCKDSCDNVESFAKSLLPEVFSKESNGEVVGKIRRPPMYFPAKIALVNYAMEYGQSVGWKEIEFESVLNSLRDVLHDDLEFNVVCGGNDQCYTCRLLNN